MIVVKQINLHVCNGATLAHAWCMKCMGRGRARRAAHRDGAALRTASCCLRGESSQTRPSARTGMPSSQTAMPPQPIQRTCRPASARGIRNGRSVLVDAQRHVVDQVRALVRMDPRQEVEIGLLLLDRRQADQRGTVGRPSDDAVGDLAVDDRGIPGRYPRRTESQCRRKRVSCMTQPPPLLPWRRRAGKDSFQYKFSACRAGAAPASPPAARRRRRRPRPRHRSRSG